MCLTKKSGRKSGSLSTLWIPVGVGPFELWPFKAVDHFGDDRAGQLPVAVNFNPSPADARWQE